MKVGSYIFPGLFKGGNNPNPPLTVQDAFATPAITKIRDVVLSASDISSEQFFSSSRKREIVEVRQLHIYFVKAILKLSWKKMEYLTETDLDTCRHSCRTVENRIVTDKQFKKYVEEMEAKIKSVL